MTTAIGSRAAALTAFSANFIFIGSDARAGLSMADAREKVFLVEIGEGFKGLIGAFNSGFLHVGVTEFLSEPFNAEAEVPYPFTLDEQKEFIAAKNGKPCEEILPAQAFYLQTTAIEFTKLLRKHLGNRLGELGDAQLEYEMSLEAEKETVTETVTEATPVEEAMPLELELVNATADVLDKNGYEAFFNDEISAANIDAPMATTASIETIVEEPVLTNEDIVSGTVPVPTLEVLEQVKENVAVHMAEVHEATVAAHVAASTPTPKVEFVTTPTDLGATIAQAGGLLAEAIENTPVQGPRELKLSPTEALKAKVAERTFGKKQGSKSRQQRVSNAVKKEFVQSGKFRSADKFRIVEFIGELEPVMAHCKPLHSVYPYLGSKQNTEGVPCVVSRVSAPAGQGKFGSAGMHWKNLDAGEDFLYPSVVIDMDVYSGHHKGYVTRKRTVPMILQAPIKMIEIARGKKRANLVIEDSDAIMATTPICICVMDTKSQAYVLKNGAKLVGEYKPFQAGGSFFVFQPANAEWIPFNTAVENSAPYISRRK